MGWYTDEPRLIRYESNITALLDGRGNTLLFVANNAHRAANGSLSTSGGETLYTSASGVVYRFDTSDRFISKTYPDGRTVTYTRPEPGLVVQTDQTGRSLQTQYTEFGPEGHLLPEQLTDPEGNVYSYLYDDDGYLERIVFPHDVPGEDNPYREYSYQVFDDGEKRLSQVRDELGAIHAQWHYDDEKRATLSQRAGGAGRVEVVYHDDEPDEPVSRTVRTYRTDQDYAEVDYTFAVLNGSYKPLSESPQPCPDCIQGDTHYQYDQYGYLEEKVAPDGTVTRYTHNHRGQQTSRTQAWGTPEEYTVTTTWDSSSTRRLPLTVEEPHRRTTYTYDNQGNRTSVRVRDKQTNDERVTSYTYNSQGQVLTESGPRTDVNDVTQYSYDAQGNLASVTNALGHQTLLTDYDAHGNLLAMTDPNGVETTFSYHPRGWVTASTTAGATTTYEYLPTGSLARVTSPIGATLDYTYDNAHRLIAIQDAEGNRIDYTLDFMGNQTATEMRDASGVLRYSLAQVHNNLGQLTQIIRASGDADGYLYDALGRPIEQTDALSRTTDSLLDPLGRLRQQVAPDQSTIVYDYNAQGDLTAVTDPAGLTTAYSYNAFGDLITQISPDTGTTSHDYDAAGNRTRTTDSRGVVTDYQYDALNRLTHIQYPAAPAENITYSYDDNNDDNPGIGRLTGIQDASGSTAYRYNALGQVTRKTVVLAGQTVQIHYDYDAAGQLTGVTYPSGRTLSYSRDAQGRIETISTQASGQAPKTLISGAQYLPFGPATHYSYGNGLIHQQTYDLDYRLTDIEISGISPVLERVYSYDPVSNITDIENSLLPAKSQSFSYDALNRLMDADGPYGFMSYDYDSVGNRLGLQHNDGTQLVAESYSYASDSHRLLTVERELDQQPDTTRSYQYDPAGNRVATESTDGTRQDYDYNAANRMSAVSVDQAQAADYHYNALGQRVRKILAGGNQEHYHYDEAGQLLAVTDDTGSTLREYVYWDSLKVAVILNGTVYYLHNDHLGTPQVATDQNQAVVWMADYEPFGRVSVDPASSISLFSRFPGQYFDQETGLHYNYFRDYDPALGRYIQSDPIGLEGGINTYGYALQNPVKYIDPFGLSACTWGDTTLTCSCKTPTRSAQQNCKAAGGIPLHPDMLRGYASEECDDAEDASCEALYQSILQTCAGLTGRKQFKCFEAARKSRDQCYQEKRR
ncbi:MAG: RHS domain-containing protein [Alcanivorax sp.]|nr:RHS domain-containing protein [Alcanivorax sp.]